VTAAGDAACVVTVSNAKASAAMVIFTADTSFQSIQSRAMRREARYSSTAAIT
jgi:hypothetical protein